MAFLAYALLAFIASARAVDITITAETVHEIPETLFGYMWEDINHSGDGGLYAELIQNRAFQAVEPGTDDALAAWTALNNASISVIADPSPLSSALPNALSVSFPSNSSGPAGIANEGFWGIRIDAGSTYTGSFYAKGTLNTTTGSQAEVTLQSKATGDIYASAEIDVSSLSASGYTKYSFELKPEGGAPDTDNLFTVTFPSPAEVTFTLFSLFPPTFKSRSNGMRIDLAETLAATRPGVWRFPGGNNLEGQTVARRWKWNETIGPLEERPGRRGDWGYPNTDGLGLLEYLDWAEDIGAEPILGVYAGYSLGGETVPEDAIQAYVDEAIAEIEFVTGDASTHWGSVRAALGREEPYALRYVEIGNEDFFAPDSYQAYRWAAFANGLEAAYPGKFKYLATTYEDVTSLEPKPAYYDFHQYNNPNWFVEQAVRYDEGVTPRDGTQYFVGEYAVTSNNDGSKMAYPTVEAAVGEAAFMTGLERNADVVFAAAYAPTLNHVDDTQWYPDLVSFNAGTVSKSPSYWAQWLFSTNRGTHTLPTSPVSSNTTGAPLYWSASYNTDAAVVYLKVSNTDSASINTTITLDGFTQDGDAKVQFFSGAAQDVNTVDAPDAIVVSETAVSVVDGVLAYAFPGLSVSVVTIPAQI
ncbi:glycoside hydrolase family 51 protein [Cylindrobasidium torrendii FP15055 ss-10]|uniref:non-reducing end alpha-L-arabinofuranosidase n=1 Tax=Cylindrobasidium torrendii FP15055 ss-10 TaxID=1314674 RepID=A0A0D7BCZ1_9AGAR|nr:glycoside hydrolase family 51 protein [Cylindrobasidium torrendii FP15055 ss-10]